MKPYSFINLHGKRILLLIFILFVLPIILLTFLNEYHLYSNNLVQFYGNYNYFHQLCISIISLQVAFISLILSTVIIISQLIGRYQTPNAAQSIITDKKVKYQLFFYAFLILIEIFILIIIDIYNNREEDFQSFIGALYFAIFLITFYVFYSFADLIKHIITFTNINNQLTRLANKLTETLTSQKTSKENSEFYVEQILDILSKSIFSHESSTFFHGVNVCQKSILSTFSQHKYINDSESNSENQNSYFKKCDDFEKSSFDFFKYISLQNEEQDPLKISNKKEGLIFFSKNNNYTALNEIPTIDNIPPIKRKEIDSLFFFILKECCSMSGEKKYERGFIIIIEILSIHIQSIINLERKLESHNQKYEDQSQKLSEILYEDTIIFLDFAYRTAKSKKLEIGLIAIGWGFFNFFTQYIDNEKREIKSIIQQLSYYLDINSDNDLHAIYPIYSFILTYFCIHVYERSIGLGDQRLNNEIIIQLDEVIEVINSLKNKIDDSKDISIKELSQLNFCIKIIESMKEPKDKGNYQFNKQYIAMLTEILRYIRINIGTDYLSYANLLTYQANFTFVNGDFKTTETKLIRAKEIICKKYGNNINYATSLGLLTRLYNDWGKVKLAKKNNDLATYLRSKEFGYNHKDMAVSYSSYGTIFRIDSNYQLALNMINKSLNIRKIVFISDNNHLYAANLLYKSFLFIELGYFELAFEYLHHGDSIRDKIGSQEKFPSLSIICQILKAIHFNEYGEHLKRNPNEKGSKNGFVNLKKIDPTCRNDPNSCFQSALFFCDEGIKFAKDHFHSKNLDCLALLLIKVKILYNLGDLKAAEERCKKADEFRPEGLMEKHPLYILPKHNYSRIWFALKQFKKGLNESEEAFNDVKDIYSEDSIYYSASLLNRANCEYIYGLFLTNTNKIMDKKILDAEEDYKKILQLTFNFGPIYGLHCLYTGSLLNLCRLYLDINQPLKVLDLFEKEIVIVFNDLPYPFDNKEFHDGLMKNNILYKINGRSTEIRYIDLIKIVKQHTDTNYYNIHQLYENLINVYKNAQKFKFDINNQKNDCEYLSDKFENLYYYKLKVDILTTDHLPTLNTFFNLATYY